MKRLRSAALIFVVAAVLLTGCGAKKRELVGVWVLAQGDGGSFGYALEFTGGGALLFAPGNVMDSGDIQTELRRSARYVTARYRVRNKAVIRVEVRVLFGGFRGDISYELEGDLLVFDGSTYRRQTT